jgi:hypothetical protein
MSRLQVENFVQFLQTSLLSLISWLRLIVIPEPNAKKNSYRQYCYSKQLQNKSDVVGEADAAADASEKFENSRVEIGDARRCKHIVLPDAPNV